MEIRTNLAIGVMSRSCCQYYAQDLSFIELEGEDTQCFGSLAWLKEGNNPAVPLFLSLLDEYLANMAESSAN
jgi:DNA-binding transcriptional LysR family regulator